MKHPNYEPDVTGPLEGERLLVLLGLAKPQKYEIYSEPSRYNDGVVFKAFKFPRERYAAAFYAPDKLVQEVKGLGKETFKLIEAKGFAAWGTISFPRLAGGSTHNPRYESWQIAEHENDDCDPYICPVGYHVCGVCDTEVEGSLSGHSCTWYCDTHDRNMYVDDVCPGCEHNNGTCEPLYCGEGAHTCDRQGCDTVIDGSTYNHVLDVHHRTSR
jgi:hypothetical protein